MPNSLENQFIADTFKTLLHTGNISLSGGTPEAKLYSGDGFESSLTVSTATNGIKVSGNTTVYGDISASGNSTVGGTLRSGNHILTGTSNISGNISVTGTASVGSLSSGSHTVTGNSNISGTASVGSLSSGSHTVTGNSNISGTVKIGGSTTVVGSLSSGSHTITGNSKITNRIDTDVIYANTYLNLPNATEGIINLIYPIGSIFLSFTNTDPSIRFTGTQWTQVANGRFIVGVGTGNDGIQNRTFNSGNNTNGEYDHKLTIAEMPRHNHNYSLINIIGNGERDNNSQAGENYNTTATSNTGGDGFHNNTPPGFGLYVWQRTS
jgi:hypothetical protein